MAAGSSEGTGVPMTSWVMLGDSPALATHHAGLPQSWDLSCVQPLAAKKQRCQHMKAREGPWTS